MNRIVLLLLSCTAFAVHTMEQPKQKELDDHLLKAADCDNNAIHDVKKLVAQGASINAIEHKTNMRPLHYAAWHADTATTKFLLEQGALPDVVDIDGRTPLNWAATYNLDRHQEIAKLLLAHGASINATAHYDGRTPLHMAAENNNQPMVSLLLHHNADKTIKDKDGKTALDCASNPEVQALLIAPSIP